LSLTQPSHFILVSLEAAALLAASTHPNYLNHLSSWG
jgi:hypothetical protein